MKTKSSIDHLLGLALCGLLLGAAPPSLHAQHRFTRLHSFGATNLIVLPPDTLIEGRDGVLYGTAHFYGDTPQEVGAVVKIHKDGTGYAVLHMFSRAAENWEDPVGVIEGSDGALYGTCAYGSSHGPGRVFRLNKDGTGYRVLYQFADAFALAPDELDWASVSAPVEGSDGALYGTTVVGGAAAAGTVFRLNKDGSGFALLHEFTGGATNGAYPLAALIEGRDGALYGATIGGGSADGGTVFKLNKDGAGFTLLHQFDAPGGIRVEPCAPLLEGGDGLLYCTTSGSWEFSGTVFRLAKNGTGYSVLHTFTGGPSDGYFPETALVEGTNGIFVGTTARGGSADRGTVYALNSDSTAFSVVCSLTRSRPISDDWPYAPLVRARDGFIYGVTWDGGTNNLGTLFKLNPDGTGYQVLTSFQGNVPINDGCGGQGRLLEGSDGALYGTTLYGGTSNVGTIFKLNKDGTNYRLLHDFEGGPVDGGGYFNKLLVQGGDGVLYGTTYSGGVSNAGTVFKLNLDGTGYRLLHSFLGGTGQGAMPIALVEGTDGSLYGMTSEGGMLNLQGTVFKLGKDGTGYTVLYGVLDGVCRVLNDVKVLLLQGSDCALYGATQAGGSAGHGTVFKLNTDGTGFTLLHEFLGNPSDGSVPVSLVEGIDGRLYGATWEGSFEVLFRLNKDGSGYTHLHKFALCREGSPVGPLLEGQDDLLYGTSTEGGGLGGCGVGLPENFGTVFRLRKDGSGFSILRLFYGSDGEYPASITEGTDGAVYGVTEDGGAYGRGTIFRLDVAPLLYNPVWSGNVFSFQFNARSNAVYQPQFTTSLTESNWTALPAITGQRGVVTVTDTNLNSTPRFYRVVTP